VHPHQGRSARRTASHASADRDPAAINVIVSLNPRPDATVDTILTAIDHAAELGVGHVIVTASRALERQEDSLDLASRILDRVRH
jgi:hypothetical protein